jgi:hypothetical protein
MGDIRDWLSISKDMDLEALEADGKVGDLAVVGDADAVAGIETGHDLAVALARGLLQGIRQLLSHGRIDDGGAAEDSMAVELVFGQIRIERKQLVLLGIVKCPGGEERHRAVEHAPDRDGGDDSDHQQHGEPLTPGSSAAEREGHRA